jgi:hypothetical protein
LIIIALLRFSLLKKEIHHDQSNSHLGSDKICTKLIQNKAFTATVGEEIINAMQ